MENLLVTLGYLKENIGKKQPFSSNVAAYFSNARGSTGNSYIKSQESANTLLNANLRTQVFDDLLGSRFQICNVKIDPRDHGATDVQQHLQYREDKAVTGAVGHVAAPLPVCEPEHAGPESHPCRLLKQRAQQGLGIRKAILN